MDKADQLDPFPQLAVIAILLVATMDLVLNRLTIPILYTIPLLMYALSHRRRWLPLLAGLAILLTFVVLAINWQIRPRPVLSHLLGWRVLNRSLASMAIALCAGLLYYWVGLYRTIQKLAADADLSGPSSDASVFRSVLYSMTVLLAAMVGGMLTVLILVADVLSPSPANLPILYAVPLMLVSLWLQSRRVLWAMLPFLLCFTVIGYWFGPVSAGFSQSASQNIVINRVLAGMALIIVAGILHAWISRQRDMSIAPTLTPAPAA